MLSALDLAQRGFGSVVLIEGRPGTGKTRLLQEAARAAWLRGFTMIERCRFGPDGAGAQTPAWLAEQLHTRIEEQAASGPVLIALDDVRASDAAWLPMSDLLPQQSRHPVMWMLTRNCAAGDPWFDQILGIPRAFTTRIELGPLPDSAVADIAADLLGARPAADLLALIACTGDDPLLTVELIEGLREEGRLAVRAGEVCLLSAELPQRVNLIVQQRLAVLSAKARNLLQVASVLGRTFAVRDVAELLREATAALLPPLQEALTAGILVSAPERLAFRHDIVWQVVTGSLPPSVHEALRCEVGLMLVARGDAGSAPAASPPVTAHQVRGALEAAGDSARLSRVVGEVEARLASGHLSAAASLAQEALAQPLPPLLAGELHARLAHILIMSGQSSQAAATAERALAEPDVPGAVRENAAAALVLALSLHDTERARREATATLADPTRTADDPAVVTAATVLSNLMWDAGELTTSLRLAQQAVSGIGARTPATWRTHARLALARKLSNTRDFAAADAIIRDAEAEIDQHGIALHAAAPAIARARLQAQAGRLVESRIEARTALVTARELGAHLLVPLALAVLATAALRTGDLLAAADYVRRYRTDLPVGNTPLWSVQYDWVELLLAAEQDGPRRAADLLTGTHADLPTCRVLFVEESGAAAWLVRLARAVGDADLATTVVHTVESLAADNPGFPTVEAAAVHARGLYDGDPVALARAATEHLEPWAGATAAEDLGILLADSDTDTAVRYLERALLGFEHIGAEREAARVRNGLRALGISRRRAGAGRPAVSGWGSLNDMERTIAHLVNQSMTNRQIAKRVFLSPHTVNYHLRQIFRKLDINSRVELARLTQEQYSAQGGSDVEDQALDAVAY